MTTKNKKAKSVNVETDNLREFLNGKAAEAREKALKRFEVKVFWDIYESEADEVFLVELISKSTNKRVTFTKDFFESPKNRNKVMSKLNRIGVADSWTIDELISQVYDLIDDDEFEKGGFSESSGQPLEWDKQVAMKNAKLVARNFLRNRSRFVFQSSKSYDSSKHLGVILDQEQGLPEGTIAVGFKGSALQAVLNPFGRIQSQKYRREILGGLVYIDVLDAEVPVYDDEEEEFEENEVEEQATLNGYSLPANVMKKLQENGVSLSEGGKTVKKKKKSHRLDKQKVVTEDKVGVKFYIMHFDKSLLEEVAQYVAA